MTLLFYILLSFNVLLLLAFLPIANAILELYKENEVVKKGIKAIPSFYKSFYFSKPIWLYEQIIYRIYGFILKYKKFKPKKTYLTAEDYNIIRRWTVSFLCDVIKHEVPYPFSTTIQFLFSNRLCGAFGPLGIKGCFGLEVPTSYSEEIFNQLDETTRYCLVLNVWNTLACYDHVTHLQQDRINVIDKEFEEKHGIGFP